MNGVETCLAMNRATSSYRSLICMRSDRPIAYAQKLRRPALHHRHAHFVFGHGVESGHSGQMDAVCRRQWLKVARSLLSFMMTRLTRTRCTHIGIFVI